MKNLILLSTIICISFITFSCNSQPSSPATSASSPVITTITTEQETAATKIDYNRPELYLKPGTQSTLNEKYAGEINTQLNIENNDMKAVSAIFFWKQDYFDSYAAGGKLIGKTNINQIMEEQKLSGCHDHALVLASVLRKYGLPAIMADAAGIQWAEDYATGKRRSLAGHVFVEVYVNYNWILVNSTSGEYVENYDTGNPVIPMTNPDESKGYFVLLKGLDPEEYGIRSLAQLKAHMISFSERVKPEDIEFPEYEIKRLSRSGY